MAVLVGPRSRYEMDTIADFQKLGHNLVASGYNVAEIRGHYGKLAHNSRKSLPA